MTTANTATTSARTPHRLAYVAMHRVAGMYGARVGTDGCPELSVTMGLNEKFTYEQKTGQSVYYGRIMAEGDIKDGTPFNDAPCFNKIDLNTNKTPSGPDPVMLKAYQDSYLATFLANAPDRVPASKQPAPAAPAPTPEELPTEVPVTPEQLASFEKLLAAMPTPPVAYDGSLPPGTPGGPPLPGKAPVLVMKPIASSPEELVRAIAKARTPGTPGASPTPTSTAAADAKEKSNTVMYVAVAAAGVAAIFLLK